MRDEHAILLVVVAIVVFIAGAYFINRRKDGFADLIDVQNEFIREREENYNSLGIGLISSNTVGNLGTDTRPLLGTPDQVPIPEKAKLGTAIKNKYPLKPGRSGIFGFVEKCEAIKTASCSAFDDPTFGTNCGLCLEVGMNSQNQPAMGGLVLLPDDRKLVESSTPQGFIPDYVPTLGSCPAGKMVANKAQCIKLTNELLCAKNASYDATPGCSQCYADGTYFPVNPRTSSIGATITLIGNGILHFTETGYQDIRNIKLGEPYEINLRGKENTRLIFEIKPCTLEAGCSEIQVKKPIGIAGYLSGDTLNGETTLELGRLIITDAVTGRKPLTKGSVKVGDIDVRLIGAGFGKDSMSLIGTMPFTFLDTTSEEVSRCTAGPYVTTQDAAAFLDSDPCYKKGTGPGSYTLECLQNTMDANGCLSAGKGYPKDPTTAAILLTAPSGQLRTINEIANFIYEQAVITSTGVDMGGNTLTIQQQSKASVFCTGIPITSPCDFGNKDTGPLTVACIDYLWKNTGSSGALGPTYDRFSQATSLFSKGKIPRFCQSTGTLAPVDDKGKTNSDNLKYWQDFGGVKAVKMAMAQVHLDANSEMSDEDKKDALMQCYGTTLAQRPKPSSALSTGCKYLCGSPIQKVRITQTNGDYFLQCGQLAVYNSTGDNVAMGSAVTITGTDGTLGTGGTTTALMNNGKLKPHAGFLSKSRGAYVTLDLGTTMDIITITYYSSTAGVFQNWSVGLKIEGLDSSDNILFSESITKAADYTVFNLRNANANVEECMKCENKMGKQVYWIARGSYGPEYSLVQDDAASTCESLGGKVATMQQINAAIVNGMNPCASGWVKSSSRGSYMNLKPDYRNPDTGASICNLPDEAGLPPISPSGNPQLSGAFCYGKRPVGDSSVFGGAYRKIALDAYRPFFIRGFAPGNYTGPDAMPGNSI